MTDIDTAGLAAGLAAVNARLDERDREAADQFRRNMTPAPPPEPSRADAERLKQQTAYTAAVVAAQTAAYEKRARIVLDAAGFKPPGRSVLKTADLDWWRSSHEYSLSWVRLSETILTRRAEVNPTGHGSGCACGECRAVRDLAEVEAELEYLAGLLARLGWERGDRGRLRMLKAIVDGLPPLLDMSLKPGPSYGMYAVGPDYKPAPKPRHGEQSPPPLRVP